MQYFVFFKTDEFDPFQLETFYEESQVLEFLNKHARYDGFEFEVIEGRRKEYVPVEIVKAYKAA